MYFNMVYNFVIKWQKPKYQFLWLKRRKTSKNDGRFGAQNFSSRGCKQTAKHRRVIEPCQDVYFIGSTILLFMAEAQKLIPEAQTSKIRQNDVLTPK